MNSVEIEQKSYEMPPARGSALHISSRPPTLIDPLAGTRKVLAICRYAGAPFPNTYVQQRRTTAKRTGGLSLLFPLTYGIIMVCISPASNS